MREKKAKKHLEAVKKTYNVIAQEFSQSRNYIGKEFELFKPYLKKEQNIVDLGCGNGRILHFLESQLSKFHYQGIDNSEKLLEEAKKHHPQATFITGDQLHIPLPDHQTDLIFSIRAFHHLPSEKLQLQSLAEMHRILKKNGVLIITVWNLWQKKYWRELTKAILRNIFSFGTYTFRDTFIPWNKAEWRYYHAFTENKLKKLIKKSGFELIKSVSVKEQKALGIHDYIIIAKKIP